jgi:hypothetical protein
MPIRINFLAEHQAAEAAKRRDPVKRVQMIGVSLVLVLIIWSAYLQVRLMAANSKVDDVESRYIQIEAQHRLVRTNFAIATDAGSKLAALRQLATDRFLWARPLNALQYVAVEDVELSALRGKQSYTLAEATPAVTNKSGTIRAKAAASREKVVLHLEARDYSTNPGDHIRLFQDAISENFYFKTNLHKVEMTGRSPIQSSPSLRGGTRSFVVFTLECQYPERVRNPEFLR